MNPWLEEHWPGVHSLLINCLAIELAGKLPPDLAARPEEGVSIAAGDLDEPHRFRADVAVTRSWREGVPPAWNPSDDPDLEARAAIPVIVMTSTMTERWIEIREATGTLVTVIEILSPANKTGEGWHQYQSKRTTLLESPINLVEIDLLLAGRSAFPESSAKLPALDTAHYFISTKRAGAAMRREILRPLLREPLPVIRIPLRKGEKDLFTDLQSLVNQVHAIGRYDMLDDRRVPDLPLTPADRDWLLKAVG
jgi:hypothetical protein